MTRSLKLTFYLFIFLCIGVNVHGKYTQYIALKAHAGLAYDELIYQEYFLSPSLLKGHIGYNASGQLIYSIIEHLGLGLDFSYSSTNSNGLFLSSSESNLEATQVSAFEGGLFLNFTFFDSFLYLQAGPGVSLLFYEEKGKLVKKDLILIVMLGLGVDFNIAKNVYLPFKIKWDLFLGRKLIHRVSLLMGIAYRFKL